MKNWFFTLAFLSSAMSTPLSAAQLDPVNGVAVIVNDTVITIKDIYAAIRTELQYLSQRYHPANPVYQEQVKQLQADAVEGLVQNRLILDEFKTSGYILPESWIESRINEDVQEHGDLLTLTKTLQGEGLTYESYRQKVRERIIVEAMTAQNISQEILISPYKIEQFYEQNRDQFAVEDQVRLRMIVFPDDPNEPLLSPRNLAEECLEKIRGGVSFEEMARVYTEPARRAEGGDWGWLSQSMLRSELAEVAFALKPGEMSDVIETPEACYLMKVEEKRAARIKPIAEVRDLIEADLREKERQRLRRQWIGRLKDKAFIRYF